MRCLASVVYVIFNNINEKLYISARKKYLSVFRKGQSLAYFDLFAADDSEIKMFIRSIGREGGGHS